jgi:aryl-alcohol dehydrogenase-like predicted oxidoreductase
MRSAAVRFVLENETVSSVVLGPRTSVQLDQLIRECNTEPPYLSEGKLHALEARLKDLDVPR